MLFCLMVKLFAGDPKGVFIFLAPYQCLVEGNYAKRERKESKLREKSDISNSGL